MNLLEAAQALANAEREVTRAEADLDEADKALQEASATYRSRNDWAFDARMERDAAIAKMRHLLSLASDEPAALEPATPAGYAYITHNGTGMPVPRDTIVEVISPSGLTETGPASRFNDAGRWFWVGCEADKPDGIKLYRVLTVPTVQYVPPASGSVHIPEGFTAHDRGECPVDPDTVVETIGTPSTADSVGVPAKHLDWDFVVAYRILQPAPEPASEQDAPEATDPQTDAGSAQAALPEGYSPISEWDAEAAGREAWVSFWYSDGGETPIMTNDPLLNGESIRAAQGFKLIDRSLYELNPRREENGQPLYVLKDADNGDAATAYDEATDYVRPYDTPIAPGEVQPDPATHIEHDGTGYWTGTVDGETP